jgi:hypothetical protein
MEKLIVWSDTLGITDRHPFDPRTNLYHALEYSTCEIDGSSVPKLELLWQSEMLDCLEGITEIPYVWLLDQIESRWVHLRFAVRSALIDELRDSVTREIDRVRAMLLRERANRKNMQWWFTRKDAPKRICWAAASVLMPMAYMVSPFPLQPSWLRSGPIPVVSTPKGSIALRPRVAMPVALITPDKMQLQVKVSTLDEPIPIRMAVVFHLQSRGRETGVGVHVVALPSILINALDLSDVSWLGYEIGEMVDDIHFYYHPNDTIFRNTRQTVFKKSHEIFLMGCRQHFVLPDWRQSDLLECEDGRFALLPSCKTLEHMVGKHYADGHFIALRYMNQACSDRQTIR